MELWRKLKVGDKIRFTEIPPEFLQKGYYIHHDTMRVYKKLLARNRSLRVYKIDEYGSPWIQCRFPLKDGRWERHHLVVDHGGFVLVKSRGNA
jgi:hypothetical protein